MCFICFMQQRNYQRYLTPIRTYFTRWLIRTNSHDLTRTIYYDLSKPQWRVGLGVGLGHFTVWRRAEIAFGLVLYRVPCQCWVLAWAFIAINRKVCSAELE